MSTESDAVEEALLALADRVDKLGHEPQVEPSGVIVPNWAMTLFLAIISASIIGLTGFVLEARERLAVIEAEHRDIIDRRFDRQGERIEENGADVRDLLERIRRLEGSD